MTEIDNRTTDLQGASLSKHGHSYDAKGNIMRKLDGTGTAVMSVDYDPFGNIIDGTLIGESGFSTKPLIDGIEYSHISNSISKCRWIYYKSSFRD